MTTTLTRGATVRTPTLLLGYRSVRDSGNIIQDRLDDDAPSVVLDVAGLRNGTFRFLCNTSTLAFQVESLHVAQGPIVLADSDVPAINMTYVTSGRISNELISGTTRWIVEVDYQEVDP